MPYKTWVVGEEVLAADFNDYLQEQVVATFATSAARASALGSPVEGQLSYLADSNQVQYWNGSAWTSIMPPPQYRHFGVVTANNSGGIYVTTELDIIQTSLASVPYAYRMTVDLHGAMTTGDVAFNFDIRDEGGATILAGLGGGFAGNSAGAVGFARRGAKDYAAGVTCGYSIFWLTNAASNFEAFTTVTLVPQ